MTQLWTEDDYNDALTRLDVIFDATEGDELAELKRLVDKIVAYEDIHYPIDKPKEITTK